MRFLKFSLVFSYVLSVFSQQIHNSSAHSPNAYSIGRYGDFPITPYNGTVGVEIPLYSLTNGDIKIPITLSHHSEAVKPNIHPGWVGLNWTLKTGGVITRIVKGIPDESKWEMNYLFFDSDLSIHSKDIIAGSLWNTFRKKNDWDQHSSIKQLSEENTKNLIESEPDEFIFNFNGYSGSFYINKDGKIIVIGNPSIKIKPKGFITRHFNRYRLGDKDFYYSYATKKAFLNHNIGALVGIEGIYLKGFTIHTPDGYIYDFGLKNNGDEKEDYYSIEASEDFFSQVSSGDSWDSWYLNSVTSPSGNKVFFEYYPNSEIKPIAYFENIITYNRSNGSYRPTGILGIFGPVSSSSMNLISYKRGKIIYPVYLKSIETNTEKIEFEISDTKELKYDYNDIISSLYIQANDYFDRSLSQYKSPRWSLFPFKQGGDVKCFSIQYNIYPFPPYMRECLDFENLQWKQLDRIKIKDKISGKYIKSFSFEYSKDFDKRLMLYSLKETNNNENTISKYSFEYDETVQPPYMTNQVDHWGYYNGKTPSIYKTLSAYANTIPTEDMLNFHQFKEPDFNYAKMGALKKIIYPTGGSTEFEYELNNADKIIVRNEKTGSFSLSNKNVSVGGLRVKKIKNIAENGEYIKEFKYFDGIMSGYPKYFWQGLKGHLDNGHKYEADRFISEPIVPLSTTSLGNHIGYGRVEEIEKGKGKKEYLYQNFEILDDNFLSSLESERTILSPFSSRKRERGLLKEENYFLKSPQGKYDLQRKIEYSYKAPDFNNFIRAINSGVTSVLGGNVLYGASYKIYNFPILLESKKTYEKEQLISSEIYKYNEFNQITDIDVKTADNTLLKTKYSYATELNNLALIENNIINTPLTITEYKNKIPIAKKIKEYKNNWLFDNKNRISEEFHIKTNTIEKNEEKITDIKYENYDKKGNLLEYTDKTGLTTSILYGYNETLPILIIEDMRLDNLMKILGVTDLANIKACNLSNKDIDENSQKELMSALDEIRSIPSLKNKKITTYTYDPLIGITSMKLPDGTIEFYKYDENHRLYQILDLNKNVIKEYKYNLRHK